MLKLIVHHSPALISFLLSLKLNLSKPQFGHVLRLADALITTEMRHKTVASLYQTIVDAPDPTNGCDHLRISPWTVAETRGQYQAIRDRRVVRESARTGERRLYVPIDDSFEATEKWFAVVFLVYLFLQYRLNHAQSENSWRSIADVIRHHRQEHARTLLETACQEAMRFTDYLPVIRRLICSPA